MCAFLQLPFFFLLIDRLFLAQRYVLLLWLSIIVMVPFDLTSIDSGGSESQGTLIERMVSLAKFYLGDPGKVREGAAELVSRLLTRPDMRASHLASFIAWCGETLKQEHISAFLPTGVLAALATLFKHGHRNELLPRIDGILDLLDPAGAKDNVLLRKLHVKLAQRVGLTYLPPRVAAWRYIQNE
jgi:hypothetical protein